MLIKKTGRQSSPPMLAEMMKPAAIGPRMAETPMAGPNALTARGNCGLEKEVMRMLIPWGIMRAPKPPWMSLPTMIIAGSTDRPHMAEAKRSPRRPPTTSNTPMARA